MEGKKEKSVIICGNYGATNLGDEAILDGIITLVRHAQPNARITVMSANPQETAATHGVQAVPLFPAGVRSFARGIFKGGIGKTVDALKNADLFILGGGGLFSDERPMAVVIWSLQAWMARLYGKKIFCLGQSVGPLRTFFGKRMTRGVFSRAAEVSVRDTASSTVLQSLEVTDVNVLADPAFALTSDVVELEKPEPYVVMTVRPWIKGNVEELNKKIAQFIDWVWQEKRLKTVLIPFQIVIDNDAQVLNQIFDQVKNKEAVELFEYSSDYKKVLELIGRSRAVVGMRLHSLIFSTICTRPFLALSYSKKVNDFATEVGMEEFVMDWPDFELQDLCHRFDELLKKQEHVSSRLQEALLKQRGLVLQHVDMIKKY